MKAYLAVFLLLVGVVLVGACGGSESKTFAKSPGPTLKPAKPTLKLATPTPAAQTEFEPTNSDKAIPFPSAEVFIEFNSTDEDVGFHATFHLRRPRLEGSWDCWFRRGQANGGQGHRQHGEVWAVLTVL